MITSALSNTAAAHYGEVLGRGRKRGRGGMANNFIIAEMQYAHINR